jgi:hypothetical protein
MAAASDEPRNRTQVESIPAAAVPRLAAGAVSRLRRHDSTRRHFHNANLIDM